MDSGENKNHRKETHAIQKKVSGRACINIVWEKAAYQGHGQAAQRGAEHARHVELRRVQRNRVGQVFARNQLRHQRLIAGRVQRHGHAGQQRQPRDFLRVNQFGRSQASHDERRDHHQRLRGHQQFAVIHVVGDYAPDQREKQDRDG